MGISILALVILQDFILNDDHYNVTGNKNYVVDNFEKYRTSCDSFVDEYGKTLIDTCISHNLAIVNGRCTGDNTGQFTCVTSNGKSVVDYYIISKHIFKKVNHMKVFPTNEWSDHRQLEMSIQCDLNLNVINVKNDTMVNALPRYIWDDESKQKICFSFK